MMVWDVWQGEQGRWGREEREKAHYFLSLTALKELSLAEGHKLTEVSLHTIGQLTTLRELTLFRKEFPILGIRQVRQEEEKRKLYRDRARGERERGERGEKGERRETRER
jgi:hypothetical protein